MNKLIGLVIVALAVSPALASAQERPQSGERVRIAQADGKMLVGIVDYSATGEMMLLAQGTGEEQLLPQSGIGAMERSVGRHRRFGKYFAIGLASTSVGVGAVSALTWAPCTQTGFMSCLLHPDSRGDAFAMGLVGGAILGIPVGLVAGLAITEERWAPVAPPGSREMVISVRPLVGPRPGFTASIGAAGH